MRLLVAGGCGFIGSNFVRFVLEHYQPEFVTNVDALTGEANRENLTGIAERYGERYEFLHGDVANRDLINRILSKHRFYAVLNFTVESKLELSISEPANFVHTNIASTEVLLKAAREHGVKRFVQVSTDEVYGPLDAGGRFSEDSPVNPVRRIRRARLPPTCSRSPRTTRLDKKSLLLAAAAIMDLINLPKALFLR